LVAQRRWHSMGKPLGVDEARTHVIRYLGITCSLPSVVQGASAAKGLMEALVRPPIRDIPSRNIRDLFLGYWKSRIASKTNGHMYVITGAMLQHIGHGSHPEFVRSE